jgi:hypothetical protein
MNKETDKILPVEKRYEFRMAQCVNELATSHFQQGQKFWLYQ